MSFRIERSKYQIPGEDHITLLVGLDGPTPTVEQLDRDWAELGHDAVAVAGILARAALDVDYAMRVQQREHDCVTTIRRYPDDVGELVDGNQTDGCDAYLIAADADDPHLIQGREMPRLVLRVPANRERAWRTRITAALEAIATQNEATTSRPPEIYTG